MGELNVEASRLTYFFGPFHLDPAQRRLLRDGHDLRLPPKVFETLLLLVERRGLIVEKDDLMKALWPSTFVEEVTLARNISLLRKALGDTPGQDHSQYIETVSKRGYRFIAEVRMKTDSAGGQKPDAGIDPGPTTASSSLPKHTVPEQPKRLGRTAWTFGGAILVIAGASVFAWVAVRNAHPGSLHSIAVLPFVDESMDASTEYITDGITEGVIFNLSEIPGVSVVSRNSVFRYKGKEADAKAAGRDLKVDAVLVGHIQHQNNGVAISAELVNVKDGRQIWGRQFRYPIEDLSRAQDEIALAILDSLKLKLNNTDEGRLSNAATNSSEAYQAYLQARFHWNQRTPAGLKRSIEFFQQATEKDPNFALAYAGMADAYNLSNALGILNPRESMPEAKAAAIRALVLDPDLAEAHAALGAVKSHYDFDLPGAQEEFLKAIAINPNYAFGHVYYAGAYLTPMGRHAEAIAEVEEAVKLDPLSTAINNYLGRTYMYAGEYQKASQQFQHTIDLDPTFPLAHFFFAENLMASGKFEQAVEENQKGQVLNGAPPNEATAETAEILRILRVGGPEAFWQRDLARVLERNQHGTIGSISVAGAYARAGDKGKAMEWLQKALEEKEDITLIGVSPEFEILHGDPRFSALLKRIGLPG